MKLLIEFGIIENGSKDCSIVTRDSTIVNCKGRITKKAIERILKVNPGISRITKFSGYSEGHYGMFLNSKIIYKTND